MRLFLSISIALIFVFLKVLETEGSLDSIIFRILGLRQLPEIDFSFIGVIIKKLLYIPELLYIPFKENINNLITLSEENILKIIIFLFYFIFIYLVGYISSKFYGKDTARIKIIAVVILLIIVYFI